VKDTIKMCMMVKLDGGWNEEWVDLKGYYKGFCKPRGKNEVCEDIQKRSGRTGDWITVSASMCSSPFQMAPATQKVCKLTTTKRGLVTGTCREDINEGTNPLECNHKGWSVVDYKDCKEFKTDEVAIDFDNMGICRYNYKTDLSADRAKCFVLCKNEPYCFRFSWDPVEKCRYSACGHAAGVSACPGDKQCTIQQNFANGIVFEIQYKQVGLGICSWHFKEAEVSADECFWKCKAESKCWKYTWHPVHKCRWSSCGSNKGPPGNDACPTDGQCPIAEEKYRDGQVYAIADHYQM